MATQIQLATRALQKLRIIGASDAPTGDDVTVALQAVLDAHNHLSTQGLLRWTLQDIPDEADLGYVLMAAYLCAPEFAQAQDPSWMLQGVRHISSFVHLPLEAPEDDGLIGVRDY